MRGDMILEYKIFRGDDNQSLISRFVYDQRIQDKRP